jgi:hypothetical protein
MLASVFGLPGFRPSTPVGRMAEAEVTSCSACTAAEKLKNLFSFGVESTALLAVLALAEERPPLLAAAAVRAAGAGAAL